LDDAKIKARIDELVRLAETGNPSDGAIASELYSGAVTMLGLTHGENSSQMGALREAVASNQKSDKAEYLITLGIFTASAGCLKSLKREVEAGLVGDLRREVTGEVLSDLLQLAKAAIDEGTEGGKNVAAVLVSAAFEDTIRRLGALHCAIHTREALPDILLRLKTAGILKGSQVGVVQSHFQFRNDAMHADWNKIDVVSVKTVMALVQELLLKHFS
jgi:hypothetical protein